MAGVFMIDTLIQVVGAADARLEMSPSTMRCCSSTSSSSLGSASLYAAPSSRASTSSCRVVQSRPGSRAWPSSPANLGAVEIPGFAANGAQYGFASVHYYWIGAIPAMVFLGIVMMPFYYGSKIRVFLSTFGVDTTSPPTS